MASRASTTFVRKSYPYFVGRRAVQDSKKTLPVKDKFTNQVVSHVSAAPAESIREAIKLADESAPKMKSLTSFQRKEILLQVAESLKKREEEIAHVIVSEVGKPIRDAKAEVGRAIDTFTVSAEEAVRAEGTFTKYDISARNAGFQGIVSRFPIGLVSMIVPFNFPLNLAAHKVGPAIAAGCPFVLKPSDRTPITAVILGEILSQTALPENSFSILPCDPADAPLFSSDPRIKALSFTGSAAVGWKLKQNSGKMRVLLELGGNAAVIVDDNVSNLDHIANRISWGGFYSQGQSCISVQRVFIHEKVFDTLVEKLRRSTQALKVGDPYDPETIVGPLITENDAIRIEKWVNAAVARGAKILTGGKRNGCFYEPSILSNVPADAEVACEEVFGPVMIVEKVGSFQQACERVNQSNYGLQAGVFTNDMSKAFYAYENLEVGGVVINEVSAARVDSMPYGGIKDSGFGREGVKYSIEEMTELKLMLLKDPAKL